MRFLSFKLNVFVNEAWFHEVIIDPHVFERHGESITPELVLHFVGQLHLKNHDLNSVDEKGFKYFLDNSFHFELRFYRMVWLIPPDNSYIGVRTVFRRRTNGKKI